MRMHSHGVVKPNLLYSYWTVWKNIYKFAATVVVVKPNLLYSYWTVWKNIYKFAATVVANCIWFSNELTMFTAEAKVIEIANIKDVGEKL